MRRAAAAVAWWGSERTKALLRPKDTNSSATLAMVPNPKTTRAGNAVY
jgi:hypothetical protein